MKSVSMYEVRHSRKCVIQGIANVQKFQQYTNSCDVDALNTKKYRFIKLLSGDIRQQLGRFNL